MYRDTKIKSQSCRKKKVKKSNSPSAFCLSRLGGFSLAFKLECHSSFLPSAGQLLNPGSKSTWGHTLLCRKRVPVEILFFKKFYSIFLGVKNKLSSQESILKGYLTRGPKN